MRVVIVEDDPMVLAINSQYLKLNTRIREVIHFQDGESAIEYLLEHPVDLILLDYFMPKMNGMTLLTRLRSNHITADVIMITAANDAKSIEQALQLGVVDYLVKPFEADRFQRAIEQFLYKRDKLQEQATFGQKDIDGMLKIVHQKEKVEKKALDKGLHPATLTMVQEYLHSHADKAMTSEAIASQVKLSRVTIRRYMTYLEQMNEIESCIDYETGGRPSIKYRVVR